MGYNKLIIFLVVLSLCLGSVSATSTYTASTETHCDDNGKCWTALYSGAMFQQDVNNTFKPYPDVTKVVYDNGKLKIKWNDSESLDNEIDLETAIFSVGEQYEPQDFADMNYSINVTEKDFNYKFDLLFNLPSNDTIIALDINTDFNYSLFDDYVVIGDHKIGFSDAIAENYTVDIGTYFKGTKDIIRINLTKDWILYNISVNDSVVIDPTIQLQDNETANLGDVYIYYYSALNAYNQKFLIKFNISSIPVGQTIDSAYLSIFIPTNGISASWDNNTNIYRINNQTWVETDSVSALKEMTFTDIVSINDNFKDENSWSTTTDIGSMIQTEYDAGNTNVSFMLEDPDCNNTNQGNSAGGSSTVVYLGNSTNDYIYFYSKEYTTDTSLRPYLNITYSSSDSTAPTYSENSTNSTLKGTDVLHALKLDDETALDTYIFRFDNGTGTLVNDSLVDISGTSHWSNVTKGINHTIGTTIRWQVFANDTNNNWNSTPIYSYTTTNAAPTTPTTLTLTDPVYVTSTLTGTCSGSTDANNDAITYYYQFYNNNDVTELQSYSTDNTYVIVVTDAHDVIRVRCKASDGIDNSSSEKESTRTVSNTAATTTTPTLSPTIGYKNVTEITCNNASVSDADGDSITWYYQWYINGTTNTTNQNITNSSYFKDDQLICEIWADDGTVNSTKYNSTTMTVLNSQPVISNVVITPSPAETSDNLNVTYTYYDIDGDTETNTYFQWYINNAENESVRYLTSGNTSLNDNIIISIKADDGIENSTWLNSTTLTIGDSTDPIIHTHYMSGTSGYTNIAFTIGINVTESNTIDWVKVEINDPNDDKTNYTMALSHGNSSEHYYIKSYTPTIVGQYDFYFYVQDGSSNYDSLNGTQYYEASTAPATPTGGGGGDTTIIIQEPTPTNLTTVEPVSVFDTITVGSTLRKELRLNNLDITPTNYTLSFSCDGYDSKLCDYLKFYNPATNERSDILMMTILDRSQGYINYYVIMPDNVSIKSYYADMVITSDKGEVLTIPFEYETTERFSLLDFISQFPFFGEWLASVCYSFEYGTDVVTSITDEGQMISVNDFKTLNVYNLHIIIIVVLGIGIYLYTKNNNNFYRQYKIFKG